MQTLLTLLIYLWYVMLDGSVVNDWLTHLPEAMREGARFIAELLLVLIGG